MSDRVILFAILILSLANYIGLVTQTSTKVTYSVSCPGTIVPASHRVQGIQTWLCPGAVQK